VKEVTVLRTVLIGIDPNQVLVLSFESKEKTRMKTRLNSFSRSFLTFAGELPIWCLFKFILAKK
jgi:hypothetical protein